MSVTSLTRQIVSGEVYRTGDPGQIVEEKMLNIMVYWKKIVRDLQQRFYDKFSSGARSVESLRKPGELKAMRL